VVIFFDPLWHSLNASVLPTLEPAMENEERREHYRQLNQNQQDRNQRKGHRNHSLPRWATSSHHSLRAIHKRIIALIAVRRSPKWGQLLLGVTRRQPMSENSVNTKFGRRICYLPNTLRHQVLRAPS
jgi:hypothetical protein